MVRRRKSNLPKWRYEFDCRKCDNIREVHDPRKGRDGDYCIPCIERMDSRRPSPIHADEKERVLRCECFTPIPEDEEGKIGKVQKPGVFHKWYDFAETVPASPFVGGAPAGQVSRTYAIVETEDGKIICCEPEKVTFVKNVHPSGGCDYCRRHNVRHVMPLGNRDGLGVVKARFCFNCGRDLSKEADT